MAGCDRPNRRDALRTLAAGTLGTAAAHGWVDSLSALAQAHAQAGTAQGLAQAAEWKPRILSPSQNAAIVVLTELIIPETDTPGARAVGVNRFVDAVLHEADETERERFLRGLGWLNERSRSLFGAEFAEANDWQQISLLTQLAGEEHASEESRPGAEFFRAVKSMTISGYYTTEAGLQQELGDDGRLVMAEFAGCDHPEHRDG